MSRLYEKGQKTTFWKHNKRKNHYLCINQKWLVLFSCLKKSVFYAHFYGRRYRPWLTESWVLLSRLAEIPQLQTALKGVNGQIKSTQQQLKDVDKLLKLDPGNTELLACIAQVKAKNGIIERENYNKAKSDDARQPKCPKERKTAIEAALRYFR